MAQISASQPSAVGHEPLLWPVAPERSFKNPNFQDQSLKAVKTAYGIGRLVWGRKRTARKLTVDQDSISPNMLEPYFAGEGPLTERLVRTTMSDKAVP